MVVLSIMAVCLCVLFPSIARAEDTGACPAGGEHEYTVTILRYATETDDGLRQYVCDRCGYTFTNTIPATGHLWSDWIVQTAPTCTTEGLRYRVCTRQPDDPHYEYETIPALSPTLSHSYEETSRTEATCTGAGSVTWTCSVCGDTYTEELPALGHDWSDWTVDVEPTADAEGSEHRTCRRDSSHVEYRSIAAVAASAPATGAPAPAEDRALTAEGQEGGRPFWSMSPSPLDAGLLLADAVIVLAWLGASLPLILRARWIGSRRLEARRAFLEGRSTTGEPVMPRGVRR